MHTGKNIRRNTKSSCAEKDSVDDGLAAPFRLAGGGGDGVALEKCLEDRDENNRANYFSSCVRTFADAGERGAYEPQAP